MCALLIGEATRQLGIKGKWLQVVVAGEGPKRWAGKAGGLDKGDEQVSCGMTVFLFLKNILLNKILVAFHPTFLINIFKSLFVS